MKSMLKDAGILFLITLVSGLLLGLVYQVTKDPIAVQEEKARMEARQEVFPSCQAIKPCKQRLKPLSKRKTAATTITGQNGRNTAAYRPSRAISTRFYAGSASL